MAMLAEPRRKQKVVNLRGGNKAWSEDSGKFGQRMLERMGWAPGRGLGAREDGVVSHVVARYKNDDCGLGYRDRADQWTHNEDQFSRLLADLSSAGSSGGAVAVAPSKISLEEKSKSSRARVHYHKFTRGKDLTRYSEKDLANIFGKKSLRDAATDRVGNTKDDMEPPASNETGQTVETDPKQVFKIGGSMHDYFSNKLRSLGRPDPRAETVSPNSCTDHDFRGFAGTVTPTIEVVEDQSYKRNRKSFEVVTTMKNDSKKLIEETAESESMEDSYVNNVQKIKKPKKSKKNKTHFKKVEDTENVIAEDTVIKECENLDVENNDGSKKKKKNKKRDRIVVEEGNDCEQNNEEMREHTRTYCAPGDDKCKSKKKKLKSEKLESEPCEQSVEEKIRKRKNKQKRL